MLHHPLIQYVEHSFRPEVPKHVYLEIIRHEDLGGTNEILIYIDMTGNPGLLSYIPRGLYVGISDVL